MNNREKYRENKRNSRKRNIATHNEAQRRKSIRRKLNEPWWKHFLYAKRRCAPSGSYFKFGVRFELTLAEVKVLWFRDDAQAFIKPSIDRLDSTKHYTFDNCRFIEFLDNCRAPKRKRILLTQV